MGAPLGCLTSESGERCGAGEMRTGASASPARAGVPVSGDAEARVDRPTASRLSSLASERKVGDAEVRQQRGPAANYEFDGTSLSTTTSDDVWRARNS